MSKSSNNGSASTSTESGNSGNSNTNWPSTKINTSQPFKVNKYIKNIQLISVEDPRYVEYCTQYKKPKGLLNHNKVKPKNETMSYLFEKTIQNWIANTNKAIENRIIYYELHKRKSIEARFIEVDYLVLNENAITIGEVKVSTSDLPNVRYASEQLLTRKELLSQIFNSISLEIIIVNLNQSILEEKLQVFKSNYFETHFQQFQLDNQQYKFLQINPHDIFAYGLQNKIIKNPFILKQSLNEVDLLVSSRNKKKLVKALKNELKNELEEIKRQIIEEKINALLEEIEKLLIQINLIQFGWALVDTLKIPLNKLKQELNIYQIEHVSINPKGYISLNAISKYVCFDNINVSLLNAELIFNKLSDETKACLTKSEFIDPEKNEQISFVIQSEIPTFNYSTNLSSTCDNGIIALSEFENVMQNSLPINISISPNQTLIIDSSKMLFSFYNLLEP